MVCQYDNKLSALICWSDIDVSKLSNYIINAVKSTLLRVANLRKLDIGWQMSITDIDICGQRDLLCIRVELLPDCTLICGLVGL